MMIFKISGKLSGNAFIQNFSKIYHSANLRRLIVFLSCYIMQIAYRVACTSEEICSKKVKFQHYDFTFFPQKYARLPSYDKMLE